MSTYAGKLLRINLTDRKYNFERIPEQIQKDYLGGRGFGIKYLYDEVAPGTDPLSPENKLLLLNGPLGGTRAQFCSKWMAYTKSPLTGTVMRAVGGGDFGAWLKWAGLDLIVIEGKAERPVYVYFSDGTCEIREAVDLWGKDTLATQNRLREIHGKHVRSACIGPAGENGVLYAVIASGRRTASRGGVGTVMGSKNLKAIAINARRNINAYDSAAFKQAVKEEIAACEKEVIPGFTFKGFGKYGTGSIDFANKRGYFPVRNFQYGVLEGYEGLTHRQFGDMTDKHTGCYGCMLRCGKMRTVPKGPYKGISSEGPEYETIWSFTGPIDSSEIGITVAANGLCDELGLDTISTGNTIGFAFELFEKGLINKNDTGGMDLSWGNHNVVLPLIKKIADHQGFGKLLALGTKRMAEHVGRGAIDCAMQVKGLELPAYDPRGLKAQGFGLATSNMGGNHNSSYATQEVLFLPVPRPVKPLEELGKGDIVKYNQDQCAYLDAALVCIFPVHGGWVSIELIGKLLAAATGISEHDSPETLMKIGERISNLERVFNIREGFARKDDTLPKRFVTEPLLKGPAEGQVVEHLEEFLDEYYALRGWTPSGIPKPDKIRELGLDAVLQDLAV